MGGSRETQISFRAVERAGKVLRAHHTELTDDLLEAFRIAHTWRDAHIQPMRSIRDEASRCARAIDAGAVTAGRLKRMRSIRKKLRRQPASLRHMQDIAGCRAIVSDVVSVDAIVARILDRTRHTLLRDTDYIAQPKGGGYRSRHLVFKHVSDNPGSIEDGQFIEVQVRTQLQHAWATAVEAVGLVRNEDLKGAEGCPKWLRLFALMSAEFAEHEGLAPVPGATDTARDRRRELRELERELDAMTSLDTFRRIIDRTTSSTSSPGNVFLIQYDNSTRSVHVRSYATAAAGSYGYREAEKSQGGVDSVLVEVDRATDLRAAYPNYYLDVGVFVAHLRKIAVPPGRPHRLFKTDFIEWWQARGQAAEKRR